MDQLLAELSGYNIDIAVISETHLKKKHLDSTCRIAGYNLIRRDRLIRKAGGVAICVRNEFPVSELTIPGDTRELERRGLCVVG